MENLIIAVLSRKRPPAAVGYAVTLALVTALLLIQLAFRQPLHRYLPYFPLIFLAALAFGRSAGLLATALSAALAGWSFTVMHSRWETGWFELVFLVLFVAIGIGISVLVEELCQAVRKLRLAESEKSLLLDELVHRTRNDLMLISSVLTLQAMRQSDPQVRATLDSAVARVRVVAQAQERLHFAGKQEQVEVSSYLKALGHGLGDLLRDVRPITVRVRATPMTVDASVAVSIGLIMNELVTNAFKYAFPEGQGGTVQITLEPTGDGVALIVQDDGIGCTSGKGGGLGTRFVQTLTTQLGGNLDYPPVARGHQVRVMLPIKPTEARLHPVLP